MNSTEQKKPLLMTYAQIKKTLYPYCKGKPALKDMVTDLWNSSVPTPNIVNGQLVKLIYPQQFKAFVDLALKENG